MSLISMMIVSAIAPAFSVIIEKYRISEEGVGLLILE